jgi:hypothetical protein
LDLNQSKCCKKEKIVIDPRDKIRKYLNDNGMEMKWFSLKVGIDPRIFYMIMAKKRPIPKKYWKAIIILTNGKISLQDLAEIDLNDNQEIDTKKYEKTE